MSQLPLSIGRIHFVGIGGIGMSGIAEILHDMGYHVTGSDLHDNAQVKRLIKKGIDITINHHEDNINGAAICVVSTAIQADNPEIIAARKQFLADCASGGNAGGIDAPQMVGSGGWHAWQDHHHLTGGFIA